MNDSSFVIGVDCGGTHTRASAYSKNGKLIVSESAGMGNLVLDDNEAISNIKTVISKLFNNLNKSDCDFILIGIAGLSGYKYKKQLLARLELDGFNVKIVNDAELAMVAKLKGQDGILAIAGTGSVVIGLSSGEEHRIGGWGHLLGDEGSGYSIGKSAVQAVLHEYDNNKLSDFTEYLQNEMSFTSREDLLKIFYGMSKAEVANLTPLVIQLAQKGLYPAENIVKVNANMLADQIKKMQKLYFFTNNVNLVFSGSVVQKSEYYRQVVVDSVNESNGFEVLTEDNEDNNTKAAYYKFSENYIR